MSENQKDLSKSLNSPLMNVIDDGMLGLKTTEIQTKMQAGVGKPDSNDATSGVSVAYRLSLSAGHGTAVGGLRNYLSADVGSGYWDFIGVCPGVMLSITDAIYHTSHRMKLPAERLVKIRVVCSGSIYLAHDALRVVDGSTVIQHFAGGKPAEYVIEANESPLQMVVLHVLPEAMQNLGLTADVLPKKLISVFGLAEAADSVFNVQASAKLVRIAREVLESRDHLLGEMRQTYVRGKAYELLCEAVLRSGPVTDTLAGGNRFRRSDIMRLHEARRILGSDLESSPTIEKLSCLVGINRTKLQAGFREFFGETVMAYRTRVRLAEAHRLIEETELSMAEIGRRIGFSHPANFTQVVKRHFGARPLELRKMTRRNALTIDKRAAPRSRTSPDSIS